jgi:hypothetical protein
MALTYSDLDAFTNDKILPRSVDIVFANDPAFVRLHTKNAERITGGVQIRQPLTIDELKGGAAGRGEGFDIDYVVTDSALAVNLKLYWTNITLIGYDELQNQSPESVFSLVETKWENASRTMAKLLAQSMYNHGQGSRSKHANGFLEWYDDGNTYASVGGIARSDVGTVGTVGNLNAYVADITSWSLKQINTAYANAWWGPDNVDLIVCPVAGWQRFWESLQPMKQILSDGGDIYNAGFAGFRFNGAEVVVSRYIPDAVMYGVNTDYVQWLFSSVPKFQFGFTGWKTDQRSIDVAGQQLVAHNIIIASPRTGFKLTSSTSEF